MIPGHPSIPSACLLFSNNLCAQASLYCDVTLIESSCAVPSYKFLSVKMAERFICYFLVSSFSGGASGGLFASFLSGFFPQFPVNFPAKFLDEVRYNKKDNF